MALKAYLYAFSTVLRIARGQRCVSSFVIMLQFYQIAPLVAKKSNWPVLNTKFIQQSSFWKWFPFSKCLWAVSPADMLIIYHMNTWNIPFCTSGYSLKFTDLQNENVSKRVWSILPFSLRANNRCGDWSYRDLTLLPLRDKNVLQTNSDTRSKTMRCKREDTTQERDGTERASQRKDFSRQPNKLWNKCYNLEK